MRELKQCGPRPKSVCLFLSTYDQCSVFPGSTHGLFGDRRSVWVPGSMGCDRESKGLERPRANGFGL